MATLQILNISKNELGVEGGKHLAKSIPKMKKLQELKLSGCNISDKGIIEILTALEDAINIQVIDFSGNQIGKSTHFNELANKMEKFLNNAHLE